MTGPRASEASRIVWHDLYGDGKYAVVRDTTQDTFGLFKAAG